MAVFFFYPSLLLHNFDIHFCMLTLCNFPELEKLGKMIELKNRYKFEVKTDMAIMLNCYESL